MKKLRMAALAATALAPVSVSAQVVTAYKTAVNYNVTSHNPGAGDIQWQMDIWTPDNNPGKLRPYVIMVHPGSFRMLDKSFFSSPNPTWPNNPKPWAEQIAEETGFVVAVPNYRLNNSAFCYWDTTLIPPACAIPPHKNFNPKGYYNSVLSNAEPSTNQEIDLQLAQRWLENTVHNGNPYSIYETKGCVDGWSAGGTLAVLVANTHGALVQPIDGDTSEVSQFPTEPVNYQCVSDNSGPVLFVHVDGDATNPPSPGGHYPINDITTQTPPTLVTHGLEDDNVDISEAYAMVAALSTHSVTHKYMWYSAGHMMSASTDPLQAKYKNLCSKIPAGATDTDTPPGSPLVTSYDAYGHGSPIAPDADYPVRADQQGTCQLNDMAELQILELSVAWFQTYLPPISN